MQPPQSTVPSWINQALQGICYWVGHRRSLYHGYPLGESAIIAETCNLIFANLPNDHRLECERKFRDILPEGAWPSRMKPAARLDLAISQRSKEGDLQLKVAIEVKRAKTPKRQLFNDLRRLAEVKAALPESNCFLLVVSEAFRPPDFITVSGHAVRKKVCFGNNQSFAKVRRVCKASSSFRRPSRAHYACLIEVVQ